MNLSLFTRSPIPLLLAVVVMLVFMPHIASAGGASSLQSYSSNYPHGVLTWYGYTLQVPGSSPDYGGVMYNVYRSLLQSAYGGGAPWNTIDTSLTAAGRNDQINDPYTNCDGVMGCVVPPFWVGQVNAGYEARFSNVTSEKTCNVIATDQIGRVPVESRSRFSTQVWSSGNHATIAWNINSSSWFTDNPLTLGPYQDRFACYSGVLPDQTLTASSYSVPVGTSVDLSWQKPTLAIGRDFFDIHPSPENYYFQNYYYCSWSNTWSPAVMLIPQSICDFSVDDGLGGFINYHYTQQPDSQQSYCEGPRSGTWTYVTPVNVAGPSGTVSVQVNETTNYTYTCTNKNGTKTQTVTVDALPVVTVVPHTINGGTTGSAHYGEDTAYISWTAPTATECSVVNSGGTILGTFAYPGTNTYTVSAVTANATYGVNCRNGSSGVVGEGNQVTFTIPPLPTPGAVTCNAPGTTATFNWTPIAGYPEAHVRAYKTPPSSVSYLTACDPNNDGSQADALTPPAGICNQGASSGMSMSVDPNTQYYWYMHTKDSSNGNWSNSAPGGAFTCVPAPIPTVDLKVNNGSNATVLAGTATVDITWTSSNTSVCVGTGFNTGGALNNTAPDVKGPYNTPPPPSYTYQIDCTGIDGTTHVYDFVTVNVIAPKASVIAIPSRITVGSTTHIMGDCDAVTLGRIEGPGSLCANDGDIPVNGNGARFHCEFDTPYINVVTSYFLYCTPIGGPADALESKVDIKFKTNVIEI